MARILVVDDEAGIREHLSDELAESGHTVFTAENAAAARETVQSQTLDLILLDIWMPDMDGISLLKELGSRRQLNCPVIMMSGHGTIETAVEATKFGAIAFLEKPFSLRQLFDAVQKALEAGERRRAFARFLPAEAPEPAAPAAPAAPQVQTLPVVDIPGTSLQLDFNKTLREVRDTAEVAYLTALIRFESGQMTRIAKRAGLERTHLYRKLKTLNIEIPRNHDADKTGSTDTSKH